MSPRHPPSCPAWISVLLLPSILPLLLPYGSAFAGPVNITVDDTSSSIVYSPASSWHVSSLPCSDCLAPSTSIAFQGTWHDGTHIIPTVDADDLPSSAAAVPISMPHGSGGHGEGKGDSDDSDSEDSDSEEHKGKRLARDDEGFGHTSATDGLGVIQRQSPNNPDAPTNPFFIPKLDSDDEGFMDVAVSARFNFTGSAVYVYALIPLGTARANSTPTFMNLTFFLDSHPAGTYQHAGTASSSGFLPSHLVFGQSGLSEAPHSLTVQIGPDSVLLLDYIVYTQGVLAEGGDGNLGSVSAASNTPGPQETGSGTGTPAPTAGPETSKSSASQSKSHNVATFAGAVGGSVGLLAVLALSLAISIYRRRMRAARRDRRYRHSQNRSNPDFDGESFHTDASEDSPPMQGPVPFVPRYFPGTVVPAPPPPYSPPTDASIVLLSSDPVTLGHRHLAEGEDRAYADMPPPTPPPLAEEGYDDYFSPPSFSAAISSPIPAILAGYSPVSTSAPESSTSPVPRHTNGSGSRGVYATDPPPTRSRANSDAQSRRSDWSDRPPSFASQAPPWMPPPQVDVEGRREGDVEEARQRTSDSDHLSVRSARSR